MVEYVIVFCMLILTVTLLSYFLYAFKENSSRTLDLAAYEYP
jgi:hypothetical protein